MLATHPIGANGGEADAKDLGSGEVGGEAVELPAGDIVDVQLDPAGTHCEGILGRRPAQEAIRCRDSRAMRIRALADAPPRIP